MAGEPEIGVGYIYYDYRDQKYQTTENILRALLKQLLNILPEIPEGVLYLYDQRVNQGRQLCLVDAATLLRVTCQQFNKVYVCLDALDELPDLRVLFGQLSYRPSNLKIFVTGQHHVEDTVQKYLKGKQIISIEAHESDIRRFIEHEIGGPNDVEPDAMDEKLRKGILETVVTSAQGMLV